ncbi:hypothetical protein SSX86_013431 [Deinandra increscens subsp. villosa]|uniref:C2H2-type domain-containing protein n=1 Tax=Deinandra increscens subsp. villosa TaxID=3103831 RepID=A0AAP0H480_9ASTR
MDQSRYWIQKEQTCLNSHVLSSFGGGDSWEEQAFAEDASGPLGGCIWPPRSYTCSFCRREFRSAQALGGHMNVHRRDRARLKKINSSSNNNNIQLGEQQPPHTSFDICVLPNPNKTSNPNSHDHLDHQTLRCSSPVSNFTCSFSRQEHHQKAGTPLLTCSKFEPHKRSFHHIAAADLGDDHVAAGSSSSKKVVESNFTSTTSKKNNDDEQIELRLASSLIRKRCDIGETPPFFSIREGLIFKKRRIEGTGVGSNFLPRNSSSLLLNGKEVESVCERRSSTVDSTSENLDLELRLGDRV